MEWIKVEDRLPEVGIEVVVFEKYLSCKTIKIGHRVGYEEYDWVDDHLFPIDKATHWMPLPGVPNE